MLSGFSPAQEGFNTDPQFFVGIVNMTAQRLCRVPFPIPHPHMGPQARPLRLNEEAKSLFHSIGKRLGVRLAILEFGLEAGQSSQGTQ